MPWKYQNDLPVGSDIEFTESYQNGIIIGKKLQSHKMRPKNLQRESTFPPCLGINRTWIDEKLYPQYGDLTGAMFRRNQSPKPQLLQLRRTELIAKNNGCGGVQKPPRQGEIVNVETEQREKTMEQEIKEHLRTIEQHKRVEREARKWRKKETAEWVEGRGGNWS
jgi:hypothetical protein